MAIVTGSRRTLKASPTVASICLLKLSKRLLMHRNMARCRSLVAASTSCQKSLTCTPNSQCHSERHSEYQSECHSGCHSECHSGCHSECHSECQLSRACLDTDQINPCLLKVCLAREFVCGSRYGTKQLRKQSLTDHQSNWFAAFEQLLTLLVYH